MHKDKEALQHFALKKEKLKFIRERTKQQIEASYRATINKESPILVTHRLQEKSIFKNIAVPKQQN
jgi:hypothetical protein